MMSCFAPRINFAVSSHGYGHLSQSIAVANAILEHYPDSIFRFQGNFPKQTIAERLNCTDFEHDARALDVGLIQADPLNIDFPATAKAYEKLHDNFVDKITNEAKELTRWGADIVIADVPYLSLAAAAKANINGIAIASLSWDNIIAGYFNLNDKKPAKWFADILSAQSETSLALLPEPAMNGDSFPIRQAIPPIALLGEPLPEIHSSLGISEDDKRPLILASLGGIPANSLPLSAMARDKRFHWITNSADTYQSENLHSIFSIPQHNYQNIVASVDGLVSKPGYGTAVEAVNYNLPFVYTCRGDFPDEPVITNWLSLNARSVEISREQWNLGNFGDNLMELIKQPRQPILHCNGAQVAAAIVSEYL